MPKPTKLHAKGRTTSLQKAPIAKGEKNALVGDMDHETAVRQFELELCWCIQQLEKVVNQKNGNATESSLQDAWKVLTILKNNNQPIIRKRQVMRTYFGDYRAKMALEEKKLPKMVSKMKINDKANPPKATFLRKSAFLTSGGESFRFNFNLAQGQIDESNVVSPENAANLETAGNLEKVNPENAAISTDNKNSSDAVNPSSDIVKPVSGSGDERTPKENEFKFTGSDFKFNFDVDN